MFRFILCCTIVAGFLILSIPLMIIEWLIGKFNRHAMEISSLRIVQAMFRFILFLMGTKVTVIGEEHLPKDHAVLYVGNHRSLFDILITYSRCPNLTGYIAKKELAKAPLLNVWMKYVHCLFLDRNNIKEGVKTILAAVEKLKHGISIFVYPEGTRNKHESCFDLLPFHEGSFKMATKSGCPIIPVAINNAEQIFEAQFPRIKPCHVVVEYGEPILTTELSKEEQRHLGAYTQGIILEMLKKNASLV